MKSHFFYLILLFLNINEIEAQSQIYPNLEVVPSNGTTTFRAIKPAGFPLCISECLQTPQSCAFIEFGDGRFTTKFLTDHHPVSSTGTLSALMTFRGKYDGGHPKGRIISQPYTVPVNTISNSQNYLPAGQNMMITSDVKDLLERDTIQIVLTFKKTFTGNGIIFFYYNDDLKGFNPIPKNTSLTPHPQLQDVNGISFNQIRTYNPMISHCTSISDRTDLTLFDCTLSGSMQNSMIQEVNNNRESRYTNLVAFNVSGDLTLNTEYNLFITLLTNDNVKLTMETFTSVRAYILPEKMPATTSPISIGSSNFSEMIFSTIPYDDANPTLRPHDPNYIIPKVRCLSATRCDFPMQHRFQPKVHAIDYKVHFQNDGRGSADSINVDVYLPTSKFDIRDTNSIKNIRAYIAGKNIVGKNKRISVRKIVIRREQFAIVRFTLLNPYIAGQNQLVKIVNLIGGQTAPMGNIDPSTMGEINFSISTQRTIPCFPAFANIYFNTESPIRTKTSILQYCGDKLKCDQYVDCDGNPKPKKEIKDVKKTIIGIQ